jgi:tetratricopeptide (TPR) repeat protein
LTGRTAAFISAVKSFNAALDLLPKRGNRVSWAALQESLATAHFAIAMAATNLDEEQIHFAASAVAVSAAISATVRRSDPDDWRRRNTHLGETLLLLHADDGDPNGVSTAIRALRRALTTQPDQYSILERAQLLCQLAKGLALHASWGDDLAELKRAAKTARSAMQLLRHRDTPSTWTKLNDDLADILARYGRAAQDCRYLQDAIGCLRTSIRLDTSPKQRVQAERLLQLALLLYDLGVLEIRPRLLLASAAAYRRAMEVLGTTRITDEYLQAKMNLGFALQTVADMTSRRDVMIEALKINADVARRASKRRNPGLWAKTQMAHALALQSLAEIDGDRKLFRQAISILEKGQAVLDRRVDEDEWVSFEYNRASILSKFGEMIGEPREFWQAISGFEAALTIDAGGEDRALTLNGLAVARQRLGVMLGDPKLLELATKDYSHQLDILRHQPASTGISRAINNRGTAFSALGDVTGDSSYYEQAIQDFGHVLKDYTRKRTPFDWAMAQLNLGGVLLSLGELQRSVGYLEQALVCFDLALKIYRLGRSPQEYGNAMHNRGRTLLSLAIFTHESKHRVKAVRAFQSALKVFSQSDQGAQLQDTSAYLAHALVGLGHFSQAEPLLRDTISRSADVLHSATRSVESHDFALDQVGDLHSLLSLCLLKRSKPEILLALRTADEGRARLLRKAVQEASIHPPIKRTRPRMVTDPLSAVPPGGALVVPVLTQYGSFVFVITQGHGIALMDREFKTFTLNHVQNRARVWLDCYEQTVVSPDFNQDSSLDEPPYERWNGMIAQTLHWLWDSFLGPVDSYLRDVAQLKAGADVVLLPTSPLNLFPLHAAAPKGDGASFADLWTVSFVPSLGVLLSCHDRARATTVMPARILAMVGPAANLPMASAEIEFIKRRYSALSPIILPQGAAELGKVRDALVSATHVHISTHGSHDTVKPRQSTLELVDGKATTSDLVSQNQAPLRLVYLSACETGLAGVRRLEQEFLGLTSGFLQAGAACVIGTLWPVYDDAAYLLARRFYELYLDPDGKQLIPPATALRQAQIWLRGLTWSDATSLLSQAEEHSQARFSRSGAADGPHGQSAESSMPYSAFHEWAGFILTGS